MATEQHFVEHVCEQAGLGPALSFRKMFGEYALYLHGRVVAFACDNQLFLKPTTQGRALLGAVTELPPYPGGKPHFRLADEIDDRELLRRLLQVTADALPLPPAKSAPKPRRTPSTTTKSRAGSRTKA